MTRKKIISTNPGRNFKVLGEVLVSSEKEIREKVAKAQAAKEAWKNIGVFDRVKLLKRVYDALYAKRDKIAQLDSQEMGFPITQCYTYNLGDGLAYFKWYLENSARYLVPEVTFQSKREVHTVYYEPTGVAAVIVPWNFPFCNWSWSVVPNLLVGNTVVFKHSSKSCLSSKIIEEIVSGCHLPEGVLAHVYGDGKVGDFLVHQNIDLISFTGSTKVGEYLYRVAAEKFIKVVLELGGSAPGIVFADANLDRDIETIFNQRFTNCGQACDGLKRLIVHEDIFDEVVERLRIKVVKTKIGEPLDKKTDFGPLVSKKQLLDLTGQVKDAVDKGATVVVGGRTVEYLKGAYYKPTLLTDVTTKMRVWQEEVFGPVLPIVPFKSEEEAVALANDTQYGLGSYIYTGNKKLAQRMASKIEAGMVSVNGANYVLPFNPFGGYKRSGMGREHGKYGLHELCQIKVVAVR